MNKKLSKDLFDNFCVAQNNCRLPTPRSGPAFANRTIGLLGGSFNPAHEGHREMSLYAIKHLGLDGVWWLVTPQNPLKPRTDMAPLAKRLAFAQKIGRHPKIAVTDLERQFGTRYTIDILRALKRRFPRTRFIWLMGADNLKQMPEWREWPAIFRTVPVAVFRRAAYAAGRERGKAAQRFSHAWKRSARGKNFVLGQPPVWTVFDNKLNKASSSAIRKEQKQWQS